MIYIRSLDNIRNVVQTVNGADAYNYKLEDTVGLPSVPVLESSVMSGPEKIRSRDPWSHIVS